MQSDKLDLGRDPVGKLFIRYAVPSVLGMLAMSTAQVVDGIFIGRFVGPEGLAAVNLSWPLVMLYTGLSLMIGTGGSTLANIRRGAGERKEADRYYSLTMLLLVILGLIAMTASIWGLKIIPLVLGADEAVELLVTDYLRIIFIFVPFFMLTFTQDLFIRGDGQPVFPVAVMIGGSISNIIFDYLFVARFAWGIEGAAFATGLSQVLPFTLMMWYLIRKTDWTFRKPVFSRKIIFRMMYNGISEFVDETSIGISMYVFNRVLMFRIGAMGVAAYSIAAYVGDIAGIVFYGIAHSIHPGVSFNMGANQPARVKKFRNAAFTTNFVIGLVTFIFLQIFRTDIAGLFVKDQEVIALAGNIAFYFSFAFLLMGINMAAAMYFTALDKPAQSGIIALSRSLVMLLIGLLVLPHFLGDRGIWLSFLFAETVTIVLVIIFNRRDHI